MTSKKQKSSSANKGHKRPAEPPDPEFGWIGKRIKEIREKRNIGQRELARICNLNIATMSRMENGETEPSLTTLRLLANGLNTTPSALLAKEDTELVHAVDMATADHQLVRLIENLTRSLEVAQSLLTSIRSKSRPQSLIPIVTHRPNIRKIDLGPPNETTPPPTQAD